MVESQYGPDKSVWGQNAEKYFNFVEQSTKVSTLNNEFPTLNFFFSSMGMYLYFFFIKLYILPWFVKKNFDRYTTCNHTWKTEGPTSSAMLQILPTMLKNHYKKHMCRIYFFICLHARIFSLIHKIFFFKFITLTLQVWKYDEVPKFLLVCLYLYICSPKINTEIGF